MAPHPGRSARILSSPAVLSPRRHRPRPNRVASWSRLHCTYMRASGASQMCVFFSGAGQVCVFQKVRHVAKIFCELQKDVSEVGVLRAPAPGPDPTRRDIWTLGDDAALGSPKRGTRRNRIYPTVSLQPAFGTLNQQLFSEAHLSHFSGRALTHAFGAACGGGLWLADWLAGRRRSKKKAGNRMAGQRQAIPRCRSLADLGVDSVAHWMCDLHRARAAANGPTAASHGREPELVCVWLLRPRKGVKRRRKKREVKWAAVSQDTHTQCNVEDHAARHPIAHQCRARVVASPLPGSPRPMRAAADSMEAVMVVVVVVAQT
ncbi:hypothetical protein B0T18DRAFT_248251 [Schizothecium vesticola]|uniref:Uncharacterized protein n=1 Tax=Schizothecium vesticola TaxID=314040 RepID=A0AA40EEH6_9PEZI|nr:hypothetical protein B0T18DRAFT_248251 [Schizothecium vesticola]